MNRLLEDNFIHMMISIFRYMEGGKSIKRPGMAKVQRKITRTVNGDKMGTTQKVSKCKTEMTRFPLRFFTGSTIHIPVSVSGPLPTFLNHSPSAQGYSISLCLNEKKSRTRTTLIPRKPGSWSFSTTNAQSRRGPEPRHDV